MPRVVPAHCIAAANLDHQPCRGPSRGPWGPRAPHISRLIKYVLCTLLPAMLPATLPATLPASATCYLPPPPIFGRPFESEAEIATLRSYHSH